MRFLYAVIAALGRRKYAVLDMGSRDPLIEGLPLPEWAGDIGGVVIPNDIAARHRGAPDFALAEYLNGRGHA